MPRNYTDIKPQRPYANAVSTKAYNKRKFSKNQDRKSKEAMKKVMKLLAVERKVFTIITVSNNPLGQIQGLSATSFDSGHIAEPMDLNVAQGVTGSTRIGDRVHITGFKCLLQAVQQTGGGQPIKFTVYFVLNKGSPISGGNLDSQLVANMWENNQFTDQGYPIYDSNSLLNIDYMNRFSILCKKTFRVKADNITNQVMSTQGQIGYKFKKPLLITYDNTSTAINQNQIVMVVLADSGNSTTTAVTANNGGIVVSTASSGLLFNSNTRFYFSDM